MGAVGGIIYLAVAAVLYPNSKVLGLEHVNYAPLFIVVSAIMAIAIIALRLTIDEPKLAAENRALEAEHPEWNLAQDDGSGNQVLPADVKRSLGSVCFSLVSYFLSFFPFFLFLF